MDYHRKNKSTLFRGFMVFAALLSLGLGIYNMYRVARRPNDECIWVDTEKGVVIVSVHNENTAAGSGLRVGDMLLRIASENTVTSLRAQMILSQQKVGSSVDYFIMRGNELLTIPVKIVRGGFDPIYLTMCCLGFVFLAVGFWIGWMRPADVKSHILYLLFLSFMLFWSLNIIPVFNGTYYWTVLILRTLSFTTIPVFFLTFFLLFPTVHPILQKSTWIHLIIISPALCVLIWFILALVFNYPSPTLLPVGIGLWGLYLAVAMIRLRIAYQKTVAGRLRHQIRVLGWGITLGSIPPFILIVTSFAPLGFPLGNYLIPLMGIIPLAFAYAVVRHKLMDIEFIIKKSFVYTMLTGLVVIFYFLVVQFMGQFLQNISGSTETIVLILSTLFVAILFAPARAKIQQVVDKAFYREAYDYRFTLRQFTRTLNTLMEPDLLMETVLDKICNTMQIQEGFFLIHDMDTQCYSVWKKWPSDTPIDTKGIKDDGLFCHMILETRGPVFISDLKGVFENTNLISEITAGILAVPIFQHTTILGILILGEKRSEVPYSIEDLDLLATLADQVAVAFENGRLHQALTEQERMKHELEIARRIQLNSLPQQVPRLPDFDIFGKSIPAREVGGDYYDYLKIPDGRLGIILGDVSGKGTSAALYLSQIQGFFRALSCSCRSPKELLSRVNDLAYESMESKSFMTIVAAFIRPSEKSITLARAGHNSVLYFESSQNRCHRWIPPGMGLALQESKVFSHTLQEEDKILSKGDILLFYSDGFIEARNSSGEDFGEARLRSILQEGADLNAETLGQRVIDQLYHFVGHETQRDDLTLVIVKVTK